MTSQEGMRTNPRRGSENEGLNPYQADQMEDDELESPNDLKMLQMSNLCMNEFIEKQ